MNMNYAVVTYGYDMDVSVYVFSNYDEAVNYLHDLWEKIYNTELAEALAGANSGLRENECYHEETFAKIEWNSDYVMRFELTSISKPFNFSSTKHDN